MLFTGGPTSFFGPLCSSEHHRVVHEHLRPLYGAPPPVNDTDLLPTAADIDRLMPRHFKLEDRCRRSLRRQTRHRRESVTG